MMFFLEFGTLFSLLKIKKLRIMEKFKIEEKDWNRIKTKLKEEYPDLTEEDLSFKRGEEDVLLGRIESRIGGGRREMLINKIKTL